MTARQRYERNVRAALLPESAVRCGNAVRVRLVLVRHGQTDANLAGALDTRPPGAPLNAAGRAQAQLLAASLADASVAAVYASTALRAQQTAEPVAARHGLRTVVLDGVQEVFAGELEGRCDDAALQTFRAAYQAWWQGDLDFAAPGGESAAVVQTRFLHAVDAVVGAHPSGDVVLISHGAAIRVAVSALLGGVAQRRYVPNAGRVVLASDPEASAGWRLESWDAGEPRGSPTFSPDEASQGV